jgi:hypothetical protein
MISPRRKTSNLRYIASPSRDFGSIPRIACSSSRVGRRFPHDLRGFFRSPPE